MEGCSGARVDGDVRVDRRGSCGGARRMGHGYEMDGRREVEEQCLGSVRGWEDRGREGGRACLEMEGEGLE